MEVSLFKHFSAMAIYALVLYVIVELFRKNYKVATYFYVLVLLSSPLWLQNIEGWFRWMKYLSIFVPIIILGYTRIAYVDDKKGSVWNILKNAKFLWFFYAIMFLNIIEATIQDIELGNYFNAAVGLILCATIPYATKYWRFRKKENAVLIAYTTIAWAFLYTTWNACFVYSESPMYFAGSLTILLVAFLYPVIKKRPELYVHARVYTLATHLLLRATFDIFPSTMDSSSWFNTSFLMWWGIINLAIAIPYLFWHIYQLYTGNTDQSFGLKIQT
ncbi:hypothetical protein PRVXH_001787 [Proteinivorax hydrogeniformans]|uniref:Uncharacterized protein n=1 Tax=Proteinivorax hydrogeniformans TaxID=1826727 RepID=A0AAU8HQP6_9FIRM